MNKLTIIIGKINSFYLLLSLSTHDFTKGIYGRIIYSVDPILWWQYVYLFKIISIASIEKLS